MTQVNYHDHMATVYRSGDKWRAEICVRGQRKSRRFHSKARARAWAEQTEQNLRDGVIETSKTLADAMDKYSREVSPTHKGRRWEQIRLNALKRSTIANKYLTAVTPYDVAKWRDRRLQDVSAASVRREMVLLSAVFTIARREWRWISSSPMTEVKKPPSAQHRDRRITPDEQAQLEAALPPLMRVVFLLALETAMRLGEICSIRPDSVREKYVELTDTKNGTSRNVPLSTRARALLLSVGNSVDITPAYASKIFSDTTRRLGIENLRFHDTRHEACTRLAAKLNIADLARVCGMRDTRTLMIYYNPTATELADKLG